MNKNSKKFISNDFIISLGNSVFTLTIMWYAYDLTGSALYTSLLGSLSHIMNIIFGMYLGILSDKINRPKALLFGCLLLNAVVIGIMIFINILTGTISITFLIILVSLREFIFVLQYPNQTKLIPIIDRRENISKIISFRSVSNNVASILGYGIAGILFSWLILSYTLLTILITFLIGAILISSINIKHTVKNNKQEQNNVSFSDFKFTLHYIIENPYLFRVLVLTCTLNITSMVAPTFVVYFQGYLNANVEHYGFFQMLIATGSIISALFLIKTIKKYSSFNITVSSWILMGALMIILFLNTNISLSIMLGLLIGICLTLPNIIFSTYKILIIEDEYRGSISSTIRSIGTIFIPISYFIAAFITDTFGSQYVFLLAGIIQIIIAISFMLDNVTKEKYDLLVK